MTSDTVEAIVRLASRDIFKDRKVSFSSAMKQMRSKTLNSRNYFDFGTAATIVSALENIKVGDKSATQLVGNKLIRDNKKLEKVIQSGIMKVTSDPYRFIDNLIAEIYNQENTEDYLEAINKALKKVNVLKDLSRFNEFGVKYHKRSNSYDPDNPDESGSDDMYPQDDINPIYEGIDDNYAGEMYDDYPPDAMEAMYGEQSYNEGGSSQKQASLNIPFNRYITDYVDLVRSAKVDSSIIDALDGLVRFADDLSILAKVTGVNQSVKNTFLELKKYNDMIDEVMSMDYDVETTVGGDHVIDIADIINRTPHLKSMVSSAQAAYQGFLKTSAKNRVMSVIFDKFPNTFKLDQPNFRKINSFVDEFIISRSLDSLPENKTTFEIPNGALLTEGEYSEDALNSSSYADIKTITGRKAFIDWVENTVIPDLKQGKLVEVDDMSDLSRYINDSKVASNEFLKRLTTDMNVDPQTGESFVYYRMPMDMLRTQTASDREALEMLKMNFYNLANLDYAGKSLKDIFYAYDLIINKGRSSSTSLKAILDGVADYNDNSLMTHHLRAVGEFDISGEDFKSLLDDVTITEYLAAKGLGVEALTVPKLGTDLSTSKELVKIKKWDNNDKRFKYTNYRLDKEKGIYIEVKPKVSSKYLNMVSQNETLLASYNADVSDAIMLDRLNSLITKANKIIINC